MAANIQQVRYPAQDNRPSPWEAGIQGGLSGMSGYYGRQTQQQLQQQKNLMTLLPVLAQMKMLKPGGKAGQPGVINVPGAGPFTVISPRQGSQEKYYDAKTQETLMENGVLPWTPAFARRKAISDVDKEYIKDPLLKLNKGWQANRDAAVEERTKSYLEANTFGEENAGGGGNDVEVTVYPKKGGKAFTMSLSELQADPESVRSKYTYEVDGVRIDAGTNSPVNKDEALPLSVMGVGGVAGVLGAKKGISALANRGANKLTADALKQGWSKYGAKGVMKFPLAKKVLAGAGGASGKILAGAAQLPFAAMTGVDIAKYGLSRKLGGDETVQDKMMRTPWTAYGQGIGTGIGQMRGLMDPNLRQGTMQNMQYPWR